MYELLVFNMLSSLLWEDSSSFFCTSYILFQYNSLLFPIKKNDVGAFRKSACVLLTSCLHGLLLSELTLK